MIAVLFGAPGSGKGTQAARLAQRFEMAHIATGDMLREEVAHATPLGREVGPIMAAGELIPDELMIRVIEERLARPDAARGALLDGFPRTAAQAEALDGMLDHGRRRISSVVHLAVPDAVVRGRILHRAAEEGRSDDNPEALQHRMDAYRAKTAPVLDYYERRGVPVEHVDGDAPVPEVTERIAQVLARAGFREGAHP